MYLKIQAIILLLGLGQFVDASLFGLFSSPSPTRKPDIVVSESPKSGTDKNAYQNYLRSLANTYYASALPTIRYMPVYTYQPQYASYTQPQQSQYVSYIQPQQSIIYPAASAPVQNKFASPITVLPSSSYQTAFRAPEANTVIDQRSYLSNSDAKTFDFGIPEPQISASLYDLPISGISPDFLTGGYVTKMMTKSSEHSTEGSGGRFGHAYSNGDGTKVSEEGQLVQLGNGKETVMRHGQYEYIDANGKAVLVKWVADDDGYRLVN